MQFFGLKICVLLANNIVLQRNLTTTNKNAKIMEHKFSADKNLVEQLQSLEIGDTLVCPSNIYMRVNAYASRYGLAWSRKFAIKSNRTTKQVTVTRAE